MPSKKIDYHIYSHNNPIIQTMGDFVVEQDSIGLGLDIAQLLIYEDENGKNTNLDNLISLYTPEELKTYKTLIDQVRNTKPKQEKETVTSTSSNNQATSISIEKASDDTAPFVKVKDANKLKLATKFTTKEQVLQNQYIARNSTNRTSVYNNEVYIGLANTGALYKIKAVAGIEAAQIFKRFLQRIIAETLYKPTIGFTTRTAAQAKVNAKSGDGVENSLHVFGLAIDLYLVDIITGEKYSRGTNRQVDIDKWELTLVPGIARNIGLNWGGQSDHFTKNGADTVHFDLKNFYSVDSDRYLSSTNPTQSINNQQVDNAQASEVAANQPYLDLPIHIGTVLNLPLKDIDRDLLSTETNQVVNSIDFEGFLAKQLVDLLSDKGYKRTFTPTSKSFLGNVQEIYPYISVWVWSRGQSINGVIEVGDKAHTYNHKIINVTPYVISLNTNVAENGGNFNVNLAPITADLVSAGVKGDSFVNKNWRIKEGTQKSGKGRSIDGGDYVNQSHIHYVENGELKRNRMYFDKVIQANDIVFIKFERLKLENDRGNLDQLEIIPIKDLPNQVFDMIALVDNVQQDTQFAGVDVNVTVSGRDLVKLLIEDGVYFYPTEFTSDGIFANTGATNTRLFRFNGNYETRFTALNKSVERSLKFIINNLGAIEICPGSLFEGYANGKIDITKDLSESNKIDKRSRAYQLTDKQQITNNTQAKNDHEDKEKILDKIESVQKTNNISSNTSSKEGVFESIETFLISRINEKNGISVSNQKITSWTETINNVVEKDRVPDNFIGTIFTTNRSWLRKVKSTSNQTENVPVINLDKSEPISYLETLYKRVVTENKADLDKVNVDLIKNLSKTQKIKVVKNEKLIGDPIPFINFISEINDYVLAPLISQDAPVLFTVADVDALNDAYEINRRTGDLIYLGILSKKIQDLTDFEKEIFDDIYNYIIKKNSQNKQPQEQELAPLAGIWQIIKLVIDDSVKDRRLIDASIGNENGSLLNAFRKICQDPFCEFYTDTYGDQFYFIARKKPFDRESIISMLDGRVSSDSAPIVDTSKLPDNEREFQGFTGVPEFKLQNLILDINEVDVLSDSLSYSTEAYSWYRLQLANMSGGDAASMAWAYLKGIYFDEFADIYGSKPLDITTSYVPYSPIIDKNKALPNAYFIRQGVYDLKYMIESHAHLPFTRMGTIVMNGDRRIKRGTFVRYKGTNEIFYVDSVSHSYSIGSNIDRTTTIQVSRGMVESFIKGTNPGEPDNISYFDICNLYIDKSIFENADKGYSDFSKASTANWKVNRNVFNFFLKKLQFAKNSKEVFNQ